MLNSDSTTPYEFAWTDAAEGTYNIAAVAVDNNAAETTSSAVGIVVGAATEQEAPNTPNEGDNSDSDSGTGSSGGSLGLFSLLGLLLLGHFRAVRHSEQKA